MMKLREVIVEREGKIRVLGKKLKGAYEGISKMKEERKKRVRRIEDERTGTGRKENKFGRGK